MSHSAVADDVVVIGVGVDTARYGHHVSFLLQKSTGQVVTAAAAFRFGESAEGYAKLQKQLEALHQRWPKATLFVRLDLAGHYGANLACFLRGLKLPISLSFGDPARNQGYRQAQFPNRKTDPAESHCVARYACLERPKPHPQTIELMIELRELAARLLAVSQLQTYHVNQLHNLLARVFPELPAVAGNLRKVGVLNLLRRFPTPAALAKATPKQKRNVRYFQQDKIDTLCPLAKQSIGSLKGDTASNLVRRLVEQLRNDRQQIGELRKELTACYKKLPPNHVDTIKGIGICTAAAITAKIGDIHRFRSDAQLVAYFGLIPERPESGVNAAGHPKRANNRGMSRKGNDLVRAYLYNCARAAVRSNPPCQELFQRLKDRGRPGNVALGHVMAKLIRQVYAVWKTDRPFDPDYENHCHKAGTKKDAAGHIPAEAD